MKFVLFFALFTVVQCASLTDLKALLNQPQTYTCSPTCGSGKCCVHFMTPMHGGKRQLVDISKLLQQQNQNAGLITTMCKDIPQSGERCLVHNNGEWCDCEGGRTCHPLGDSGLDKYFGTCA